MHAILQLGSAALQTASVGGGLIQKIGSYAGFASIIGLGVLAALYFSQARDVKRLREWAGRAPERSSEAQAGGRTPEAAAVRTPQPAVKRVPTAANAPAQTGAPAAAKPAQAAGEQTKVAPVATPAAGAAAGAQPAAAAAATAPARSGQAPATVAGGAAGNGPGTNAGAKVLPARAVQSGRPGQPVRSLPAQRPGQTGVIPPATRKERRWPAPRYLALIVAGVLVLGLAATVGVLALTGGDDGKGTGKTKATATPSGSVSLPQSKNGSHKARTKKSFPPAIDPATVTVTVVNGTSVAGLAHRISTKVEAAGFRLGNIQTASQQQRAESVVLYKPGSSRQARAVASKVGVSQIETIDAQNASLAGLASVVVVVGSDKAAGQ